MLSGMTQSGLGLSRVVQDDLSWSKIIHWSIMIKFVHDGPGLSKMIQDKHRLQCLQMCSSFALDVKNTIDFIKFFGHSLRKHRLTVYRGCQVQISEIKLYPIDAFSILFLIIFNVHFNFVHRGFWVAPEVLAIRRDYVKLLKILRISTS